MEYVAALCDPWPALGMGFQGATRPLTVGQSPSARRIEVGHGCGRVGVGSLGRFWGRDGRTCSQGQLGMARLPVPPCADGAGLALTRRWMALPQRSFGVREQGRFQRMDGEWPRGGRGMTL